MDVLLFLIITVTLVLFNKKGSCIDSDVEVIIADVYRPKTKKRRAEIDRMAKGVTAVSDSSILNIEYLIEEYRSV